MKCPSLNTPTNAVKTGYGCSEPTSSYGTSCFFSCIPGYEAASGSMRRTCLENKQWSGTQLQCKGTTKIWGYNSYMWGNVFMVNVSVKNIASKVGGGKGMCVKWEEGSPTSFVMMASAIINILHQNTAKTSLRFKTIKLFPENRPPRSPYFIIYPAATPPPHQLLLYGCRIQPKGQAREY